MFLQVRLNVQASERSRDSVLDSSELQAAGYKEGVSARSIFSTQRLCSGVGFSLILASQVLASCAPVDAPFSGGGPRPSPPKLATLRIKWTPAHAGSRSLLAFALTPTSHLITLLDSRGQVIRELSLPSGAAQATLADLPLLPQALVRVVSLDTSLTPLENGVWRGLGAIAAGENRFALTPASTVGGAIVEELLQQDLLASSPLVPALDFNQITPAVENWQRHFKLAHPALLDTAAIARAWPASGTVPLPEDAFAPAPAYLRLQPQDWPPGAEARVELSDPVTIGLALGDETRDVGPIPPGTWTLRVLPLGADGLASQTHTVRLEAGQRLNFPVSFGSLDAAPPLSQPRGEAAFGVVPVPGGSRALVLAGGLVPAAPSATSSSWLAVSSQLDVVGGPASGAWQLPTISGLPGVSGAAGAVHGDSLYLFGGVDTDYILTGNAWRLHVASGTVESLPAIPGGNRAYGMSAASIGGALYVTGGQYPWPFPSSGPTFRFDPVSNTWTTAALPNFPAAAYGCASGVVNDTWYLFGGRTYVSTGLFTLASSYLPSVYAYKPTEDAQFREISTMLTPRYGATASVIGHRIWVVGGIDARGQLSGAVEVFDATTNTWERRPPLKTPRAFAASGVVEGRIWVAGGLLGRSEGDPLPLATVEVINP